MRLRAQSQRPQFRITQGLDLSLPCWDWVYIFLPFLVFVCAVHLPLKAQTHLVHIVMSSLTLIALYLCPRQPRTISRITQLKPKSSSELKAL